MHSRQKVVHIYRHSLHEWSIDPVALSVWGSEILALRSNLKISTDGVPARYKLDEARAKKSLAVSDNKETDADRAKIEMRRKNAKSYAGHIVRAAGWRGERFRGAWASNRENEFQEVC